MCCWHFSHILDDFKTAAPSYDVDSIAAVLQVVLRSWSVLSELVGSWSVLSKLVGSWSVVSMLMTVYAIMKNTIQQCSV